MTDEASPASDTPSRDPSPPGATNGFPIVAIGLSAGGLTPLRTLLDSLPPEPGMAFVVVQHLDPTRDSQLPEILDRSTPLPVLPVEDGMQVLADHVYVIRPDSYLAIRDGVLHPIEPEARRGRRRAIDAFFHSLADDAGERAVCVLLSGAGDDGSTALERVKGCGGMVVAQDPETADHDSMPRAAIATGLVDRVLAPAAIGRELRDLASLREEIDGAPPISERDGETFDRVLALLDARLRLDFRQYKKATVSRRIARRMAVHRLQESGRYLELLDEDPRELEALARDLLIKVTRFFRDQETWDCLAREVLPQLVDLQEGDVPVRAWVPGCSTGEEAYTLAMLLTEAFEAAGKEPQVQLFATDLDRGALEVARAGLYPITVLQEVGAARVERFFQPEGDSYRVDKELRDRIVFAAHDVGGDPPFSHLDLISCRNLMIYLEPELQDRVLQIFDFALRRDRYLLLGSAETVGRHGDRFEAVSKRHRIYRRTGLPRRDGVRPLATAPAPRARPWQPRPSASAAPAAVRRRDRTTEMARQHVLERYARPTAVVDAHYRILYLFGPTSKYIHQPYGQMSPDLLAWVPASLRARLRTALQRAAEEGGPVEARGPGRRADRSAGGVRIGVERLPGPDGEALYFVTFDDQPAPAASQAELPDEDSRQEAIRQLESELRITRDELRASIERHETSSEELLASNEEILSINEELQSTNEELETSQEELQSINEELTSVNRQLEAKNDELEAASDDLRNLLVSTEIATLFLDRELRIRRFTPAMANLLHLIGGDVGRPLADIAARFDNGVLVAEAEQVLETLMPVESELRTDDGDWYIRRVLPFRTEDGRIDGVVATFTDVTTRKHAEESLRQLNQTLERRVEERAGYLSLILEVAVIANETDDVDRALAAAVEKICDRTGWIFCRVFLAVDERAGIHFRQQLRRSDVPVDEAPREPPRLRAPAAGSLIGQVVASREPRWTGRLAETSLGRGSGTPPRVAAAHAFPILVRDEVVGVLEFFAETADEPEHELLQVMSSVGTQLGRVIERRRALHDLAEAVWSEQRRAGQELHDTVGQQLVGLAMMARAMESELVAAGRPEAQAAADLVAEAQVAHRRVRTLSKGLYPAVIEEGGEDLQSALDDLCGVMRERFDIDCEIDLAADLPRLDPAIASQLFHIAREAVVNAANHGEPQGVLVRLQRVERGLRLEVADDGTGFEGDGESLDGMGLRIMRYRAGALGGRLEIDSEPGRGTVLRVDVPLEAAR